MTTVTENDLKRLEELIISGQKTLEARLTAIEIGQVEIKGEIKALETKTDGLGDRIKTIETAISKIPDLAEKVGELKNWRQIVIIALTALISSVVT